jgi:REP element-mobilizing transposase RayT
MPRYARLRAHFAVHHIIVRIVNGEFRISSQRERREFLRRLGHHAKRCGWRVLAYCIMSNHIHIVALSDRTPSRALMQPLLTGFALWLNRQQGRTGPVFAQRHATHVVGDGACGRVIAYVHNNVVRAGLCANPLDSSWSSHRYYAGLDTPPPWLDVKAGLELAGFDDTPLGRQGFHEYVLAHVADPRDPQLSRTTQNALRALVRRKLAAPIEISSPAHVQDGVAVGILAGPHTPTIGRWDGTPTDVIRAASSLLAIAAERICSRDQARAVTYARRVCVAAWAELGRSTVEMALALGISQTTSSYHLQAARGAERVLREARLVAAMCRDGRKSQ